MQNLEDVIMQIESIHSQNENLKNEEYGLQLKKLDAIETIEDIMEKINTEISPLDLKINHKFNDKINFLYLEVVNFKTKQVIKQIPQKSIIKLKEIIKDMLEVHLEESFKNEKKLNQSEFKLNSDINKNKVVIKKIEFLDNINSNLSIINEDLELKYEKKELVLANKNSKEIIGTINSSEIKNFNLKLNEVIGIIGMIFDNKT